MLGVKPGSMKTASVRSFGAAVLDAQILGKNSRHSRRAYVKIRNQGTLSRQNGPNTRDFGPGKYKGTQAPNALPPAANGAQFGRWGGGVILW